MAKVEPDREQIARLHSLAARTAKLQPWKFTPADRLFGVKLPGSVESAYIQTIGQMEEEFGILAFMGEDSLYRLRGVSNGGEMTELRMMALSYNTPEDMNQHPPGNQSCPMVRIDGRPFFPMFTSHTPGRTPWTVSADEVDDFEQYIIQALEVLHRKSAEGFISLADNMGQCIYRMNLMGQWVDSVETVPPDPRRRNRIGLSPELLRKLWKMPVHTHGFQAELYMLPAPYGPENEAGIFPYLLLIVDEKDGFAVHELLSPVPNLRKMELSVPNQLMKKFSEIGLKPPMLTVPEDGKLHSLLKEIGPENMPFPVKTVDDPDPITEIFDSFWESIIDNSFVDEIIPQNNDKVYCIRVALMHDKRTYRKIIIGSGQTLEELHEAIFDAFDREEEHLYTFFFPAKPTKSKRTIMNSLEFSPPVRDDFFGVNNGGDSTETTIEQLKLKKKQKFYYLFDWGDEWWHELTFEGVLETKEKKLPKIIKKMGDSPPQYPDWDEDDEGDE